MRNFKKFLALVLAMLMIVSMAVISTGAADATEDHTDAAQHLAALSIMKGDATGNLMLTNGVTRYQAALFFVQALTGKTDTATWNADKSAIFSDVPEYGTAIDYAYGINLILGRGNGVYGYNDAITYQDMLVMAVRALGYETEGMSYPYGYILAAQKLGLTDNIENVNFKAPLNRGETAQLIWDMLNTEVAYVDPISDKILYPGESGITDAITGTPIVRQTLLEKSEFADGKIETSITAFVEAEDEDDVDTLILGTGDEVAAADLGITAATAKVTYLGLPVTLYVDCAAEDFTTDYNIDPDESDAKIVFASFEKYTTVENLGDAGNIKFVIGDTAAKTYLSLGGTKFAFDKYEFELGVFNDSADDRGWQITDDDVFFQFFEHRFLYDTKDGYDDAFNTYGKVDYRVIDNEEGLDTLEILFTPYDFAQYFTRTLKDQTTSANATFTTIGWYEDTAVKNLDKVNSQFVEYLAGTDTTVVDGTTSVSNRNGKLAKAVTLAGESITSGDFMFFSYNELDNILTVAQNCGTFKTGRLTGTSTTSETVKIDGTNKTFGFKGAYETGTYNMEGYVPGYADYANYDINGDYISTLEAGKSNVKYVEADGRVVYMTPVSSSATDSVFDYAVVTIDSEILADLLDLTEAKFNDALTDGYYIDANGNVAIAVLDKTTGEWKLAGLKTLNIGEYDEDDETFADKGEIASLAKYAETITLNETKQALYDNLTAALEASHLFMVVDEKSGVYDLAEFDYEYVTNGAGTGLTFSDDSTKTNKITANDDVDPARVTLDNASVIVAVNGTEVGVRVGTQKKDNSIAAAGKFLSATSDTIVYDVTGTEFNVAGWGEAAASDSTATYYVATVDTTAEVEAKDDDTYDITITDLFDLRENKVVASTVVNVDSITRQPLLDVENGDVLYMNKQGEISVDDTTIAAAFVAATKLNDKDLVEVGSDDIIFEDENSIGSATLELDADEAVSKINVKVVTLDLTDIDRDDYDFDRLATITRYNESDDYDVSTVEINGIEYYEYELEGETVEEITAPDAGILDQFILDFDGEIIGAPTDGDEDYRNCEFFTVTLSITGKVDDGVVTINVLKVLEEAELIR